ncbi:MAG: hypothetical protein QXZ02_04070 [Candidatus Bathyarchaeia archaeon]
MTTETNTKCYHAVPDDKGYINCIRGNGHVGLCIFPCPYGQHKDRWEWDKKHIQQHRETYEPYTDYERLMLEKAQTNPYWLQMWASQGNITKQTLPSGLTILTRRKQNIHEQYILTDTNQTLDFIDYTPKTNKTKQHLNW